MADHTPPLPGFAPGARRGKRPCTERDRELARLREQRRPKRQRHRPNRNRRQVEKPCDWCGLPFTTSSGANAARFCTQLCATAARRKAWPASAIPWRECAWCGKRIIFRGTTSPYCSQRCRQWRNKYNTATRHDQSYLTVIQWDACRGCGGHFPNRKDGKMRKQLFCRGRCERNAAMRRRMHEIRSGRRQSDAFTLREIAERDGWRCHICRKRVPDRPYKGRLLDATIDHLVPLSRGGQHIRSNVALAHMRCNSRRSATGGAQLLLNG